MPNAAAWRSTAFQRCPVGSQPTTTPANPASTARWRAQRNAGVNAHARHRHVLRANTRPSWSQTTTTCVSSARSIAAIPNSTRTTDRNRANLALRRVSPRDNPLRLLMTSSSMR
jgi:hypothetical protein